MANTPRKATADPDAQADAQSDEQPEPGADVPEPEADVSFDSAAEPTAATTETTTAAGNPATVAIAEAARAAEVEQLRKERDELRERLATAGRGGVDELVMLRAETDALRQAAAKAGLAGSPKHMSEGVRQDLEMHGFAVDPGTGDALVLDRASGQVTITPKRGQPTQIDMPEEPESA